MEEKDIQNEDDLIIINNDTESPFVDELTSWLAFNGRVINEASRMKNPIIERLNFIGIADSNLDEFIRTKFKINKGLRKNIISQTQAIENLYDVTLEELKDKYKISITLPSQLREDKKAYAKLKEYFRTNVFPVIQPLVLTNELPLPDIEDGGTFIVTKLESEDAKGMTGIIRLPEPQLIKVKTDDEYQTYVLFDDVITEFIEFFYKGKKIISNKIFRVFRKIDSLFVNEGSNYLYTIKKELSDRHNAEIMMVDIVSDIAGIEAIVGDAKKRKRNYPHGLAFLKYIKKTISYTDDMVYEKAKPRTPVTLIGESMFDIITKGDVLVHFPYESFNLSTIRLLEEAAVDPNVISIKQTLYRVSKDSPLTMALINAAKAGKQVVVLLELKAKMDEYNNLAITEKMISAGVNVIFGPVQMKTHAKITLVIRKENDKIAKYANISTGNFNENTAKAYEDLSYFCKERNKYKIGEDLCELFNHLGAYSDLKDIRNLLVSPYNFRSGIEEMIDNCIQSKISYPDKDSIITIKCNAFTDPQMAAKLYDASKAGCKINLIVRGMCIIRPNMKGISENISVSSIVGRYLEHSRIFQFQYTTIKNNCVTNTLSTFIGSGDMMPRNLDHRVEVIVPIRNEVIKSQIMTILDDYLADTTNNYTENSDGTYNIPDENAETKYSVQETSIEYYKRLEKSILK